MRVSVDLPPEVVWRLTSRAEERGVTVSAVVEEMVLTRTRPLEFQTRVRARVLAGMTDRDIARELNVVNYEVSDARRKMELPANKRKGR